MRRTSERQIIAVHDGAFGAGRSGPRSDDEWSRVHYLTTDFPIRQMPQFWTRSRLSPVEADNRRAIGSYSGGQETIP
ncbi:hypothetical protein BOO71_0013132 [Deinococcus marmoris]|uniref:Uncharacterized protein n=1 Tax=Deinococcus marmoris TaxID=249408 RepID=A0A1U7NT00_9DEIO|nr:hypothetical protein BOO71_0013132 [Deinococcus marmoris]